MSLWKPVQQACLLAQTPIPASNGGEASAPACFHCGTLCRGTVFTAQGKAFCCNGCCTVFEILSANGLTDFYKLSETAGVRISATVKTEQFKFLDEPAVREKLVDFPMPG
jgi:Cu+-exporting ATPase